MTKDISETGARFLALYLGILFTLYILGYFIPPSFHECPAVGNEVASTTCLNRLEKGLKRI